MIKELTPKLYNIIIIKINKKGRNRASVPNAIFMDLEPGTTDPVGVEFAIQLIYWTVRLLLEKTWNEKAYAYFIYLNPI